MLTEQSDAVETNQIRDPIGVETLRAVLVRKGASVLADYEASGTLSESSRKLLVKIAVSELIERKGFYPQSEDKSKLARSMVALFPSLKIKMGEENEGFEHFYDPISHSGFLEIRLRNLRRNLQDDQRRYQRKRVKSTDNPRASIRVEMPAEGDDSVNEWMTVIKRMRLCQENLSTIKEAMDKTYASRRLWIAARHPTLEEFFAEFPRFVDMPYMFDTEFGKMFPGKDDMFIRKWEGTIIPKILKMSTSEPAAALTPVPEDDVSCYRALHKLVHLLPPTASGRGKGNTKCSVKSALGYLLDIKPTGTSISSVLNNPPDRPVEHRQPHLVCIGDPSASAQYIIVAENDKLAIPLKDNGLTCAIDKLFKMIWVCNVAYPVQLTCLSFL
ncbi:uncharacterized protein LOC130378170 [Gadus chalcogrammus]|uniref:uncharacterized protein LOC130378170 n=1 Tax=Gadus chalcogrammus TaxID=1042646 RepID=UPI0024C2DD04|nr:uncharacterized protein LOC130378170 [Gadus chalcogrammus]